MLTTQLTPKEASLNPQYISKRRVVTLARDSQGKWVESCRVAWWSDNPAKDSRHEARVAVRQLKRTWGVDAERMVVDLDRCLFWVITGKD